MGYMVHHALIVTGIARDSYSSPEWVLVDEAHAAAVEIAGRHGACEVTSLTPFATNGYRSFVVAPDGSKAGWTESGRGDATRAELIAWLRKNRGWLSWAEVRFGDEGCDNGLEAHDADGVVQ